MTVNRLFDICLNPALASLSVAILWRSGLQDVSPLRGVDAFGHWALPIGCFVLAVLNTALPQITTRIWLGQTAVAIVVFTTVATLLTLGVLDGSLESEMPVVVLASVLAAMLLKVGIQADLIHKSNQPLKAG